MLELKLNDFISLKLLEGKTKIFIRNKEFKFYCKPLLLIIDKDNMHDFHEITSIDDTINFTQYEESKEIKIPLEQEFWGHASNLQVWVEKDYNLNYIHTNLGFPLLRALYDAGDPKAKKVFKDEVAKRFCSKRFNVAKYLFDEGYLGYFTKEEFKTITDFYEDLSKENNSDRIMIWVILSLCFQQIKDYSKSITILERVLKSELNNLKNKKIIKKYVLLGLVGSYFYQKDHDKAEQYQSDLIKLYPNNTTYSLELANILIHKGDTIKAINIFYEIITLEPKDERGWIRLIETYIETGNFESAEINFNKALKFIPNFIQTMNELSKDYYDKNLYKKQLGVSKLILKIEPNNLNAWNGMIHAHIKLENFNSAITSAKSFLALKPKDLNVFMILIKILFQKKNYEEVVRLCKNVLKISSKDKALFIYLGLAYLRLNLPYKAYHIFKLLSTISPKNIIILIYFSSACLMIGKYHKAIEIGLEAVDLIQKTEYFVNKSDLPDGIVNKYIRIEKYETEIHLLETNLDINYDDNISFKSEFIIYAYYEYACILSKKRKYHISIDLFSTILNLVQKSEHITINKSDLHRELGFNYAKIKDFDSAIQSFNFALNIDSKNANIINEFAFVFHKKKEYSKAYRICRRALDIEPNNTLILWHMACIESHRQNTENSLDLLTKAIEINPDYYLRLKNAIENGVDCFNNLKDIKRFEDLLT